MAVPQIDKDEQEAFKTWWDSIGETIPHSAVNIAAMAFCAGVEHARATTSDHRRGVEDAAAIVEKHWGTMNGVELRQAIRALLTTEQVQGARDVDAQTRIVLLESGIERIAEVATAGETGHADDMRERFQWIKERATKLLPAPPVVETADAKESK